MPKKSLILTLASALWLVCAVSGFVVLMDYQTAAGAKGATPAKWPEGGPLQLEEGRPNLVMFLHPKCACSQASMEELNRLLARAVVKPSVRLVFYKPSESADDWTATPLRRSAGLIPGAVIIDDTNAKDARLFGADTSGDTRLYDGKGNLLFDGGITPGRGHQGDNAGADAILRLLAGESAGVRQTPVYGCSLGQCSETETNVF